jgi:putative CocE/NonD family hydrolase
MHRLNGPQTTGRTFRELSQPEHTVAAELDVAVQTRDGTHLLADVFRPAAHGRFPALVAFSCYPRQLQGSGAPMGFVEAGATDFWVARGYAHVIANARGTGGSEGTYTLMDATERADLCDVIEWAAAQPWCDGRVGMIGIS